MFCRRIPVGSILHHRTGDQPGDFLTAPTIEWTWSVEALAEGRQVLRLRIIPRLQTRGGLLAEGGPVGPLDATIDVTTSPRSTLDQVGDGSTAS